MERDEMIRKGRMRIHSMEEELLPTIPESIHSAEQESVQTVSRYQSMELIGQGAIGQVFKAYDSTLKRIVALKFLKAHRAGMEERFRREAQAQARVQHPNVCKVFEVGEIENKPYLSMQYINGCTLDQAALQMSLEEKVKTMKVVAEAVHAANKTGLIHRDLKPGNILVEKTEEGWQPYVTDFGLAREMDAPDLTRTGVVVGTPAYMAPEQARGAVRNLDQRTDVYCLGATFFEVLSGKPPFEGNSSMEVLWKILQEEAPPLRSKNKKIPQELETIVMKCLEKDPTQRYESARALSEDLARFQDDEPILARPATWHYRLRKKARKHRTIVGIAAVAFIGILLSAAFGIYSWWNAGEQAKHAQQFGQEVEKIEGFLRYVQTLPLHDVRPEMALVRERMKDIEKRIKEVGKTAEGPGHYALGRGYLALYEYEKALIHLEEAWKRNYRTPEVAYSLGAVFGELYQRQLQTLGLISNTQSRENRQKEIERQYRDPALRYLRIAKGVHFESTHYAEGLVAFYEKKYDLALRKANDAIASTPWFYHASKMEGDIRVSQGIEKARAGDYSAASENYMKAGVAYQRAMEIGRSDASLYEAECRRWIEILEALVRETIPSDESFKNGIAACDQALQINKENAEAYNKKAIVYQHWGDTLANYGKDSEPMFQKVIETAEAALRWKPQSAEAHLMIGLGYWNLAWDQYMDGKDTSQSSKKAIDSYNAAAKIKPDAESYYGLCGVYHQKAMIEMQRSLDPSDSFRKAISAGEKAAELDGSNSDTYNSVGIEYTSFGNYQLNTGINPTNSFNSAIDRFEKGLRLNPKNVDCYINLSRVYILKAEYEITQKLDPTIGLRQSIEYCQKANSIRSDVPSAYVNMMAAYWVMSLNRVESNQDPTSSLKDAIKAYDEVIRLRGVSTSLYLMRAEVELTASKWAMVKGFSPDSALANTEQALGSALKMNPSGADVYEVYAKYYKLKAEDRIKRGKNAASEVENGIKNASRAISLNANAAEVYGIQGELHLLKSKIALQEQDRKTASDEGRKLLKKALELNQHLQYKYASFLDVN
jgi:serine/threonine-protein kinase